MANKTEYIGVLDNEVPTIVCIVANVLIIIALLWVLVLTCMKQIRL
jgi:hypothetical protein